MTSATGVSTLSRTGPLAAGVIGGIVGGIAFGLLMQMMGMMPMVAMLARSDSVFVGWIVHLVIASAIGISFALIFGAWAGTLIAATAFGVGYGALWWVLGSLAAMPAILGMPMFNVDAMAGQSLMGHIVYGALLGATFGIIGRRFA